MMNTKTVLLLACLTCFTTAFLKSVVRKDFTRATSLNGVVSARTRQIFEKLPSETNTGGAGGSSSLEGLKRLDESWEALKAGAWRTAQQPIVFTHLDEMAPKELLSPSKEYDIVVSGGTLGIFYAAALQKKGFRTCVVERGKVQGRPQEWNISRKELMTLVRMGILTLSDIDAITAIEFNPVRVGFKTDTSAGSKSGFEFYVSDILNLGIKPNILIEIVKTKYIQLGGTVFEDAPLSKIDVYSDCAIVSVNDDKLSARLLMDAMGNASPIAKQIRGPVEPDGVCIVVGGCARGFDPANNTYSDVIYTDTPIKKFSSSHQQYFWEAFPAGSGPSDRTTYLFTYLDAKPDRPSINEILDDYWELLPRYQGVEVDKLEFARVLYGMFPTYRNSPLKAGFDRILQVGDASGIQSPLSFGGFGSLTRHIERIIEAIEDALPHIDNQTQAEGGNICDELVTAEYLGMINSYQPNLSACWMFQRAMSIKVGDSPNPELIVGTLSNSFTAMEKLGDDVMRPFLQDVLQFRPLLRTLVLAAGQDLLTPFKVVPQVGVLAIADFLYHFLLLGVYTILASIVGPVLLKISPALPNQLKFKAKRISESWKFGSGLDYYDH